MAALDVLHPSIREPQEEPLKDDLLWGAPAIAQEV